MTLKHVPFSSRYMDAFGTFWRVGGFYFKNHPFGKAHFFYKTLLQGVMMMWMAVSIFDFADDIGSWGEAIHAFILSLSLEVMTFMFWKHKKHWEYIFENYDMTYDYKSDLVEKYSKEITKKRDDQVKKMFHFSVGSAVFLFFNNTVITYIAKYLRGGEDIILFTMYSPIDLKNRAWYSFILILQTFVHFELVMTIYSLMSAFLLVVVNVLVQLEILKFALSKLEERIKEKSNHKDERDDITSDCIKDCIKHHIYIINYFEQAKIALKAILFTAAINGSVLTGCSGIILIKGPLGAKVKFAFLTSFQILYIFLLCLLGQIVSNKSEEIRLTVNGIEFWKLKKSTKKLLLMILMRTKNPLQYETTIGQIINLQTFKTMMQGSYTYFNTLIQFS